MKTDKEVKYVDFKHEAQLQIYKEIKNLAPEEEIEYFRRKVESSVFGKWWKKIHEGAATGRKSTERPTGVTH